MNNDNLYVPKWAEKLCNRKNNKKHWDEISLKIYHFLYSNLNYIAINNFKDGTISHSQFVDMDTNYSGLSADNECPPIKYFINNKINKIIEWCGTEGILYDGVRIITNSQTSDDLSNEYPYIMKFRNEYDFCKNAMLAEIPNIDYCVDIKHHINVRYSHKIFLKSEKDMITIKLLR